MGHSLCTSRTKVSYNWTGPDSLTQNIWAKYHRRQPNPILQKGPPHYNNKIFFFFVCVDNSRFGGIQCLGSMNSPNQCAEGGSSSPSKSTYDHSLLSKPTWPHCLFLTINLKANEKVELGQIRSQKNIELVIIS